jgi:hypothetical protein
MSVVRRQQQRQQQHHHQQQRGVQMREGITQPLAGLAGMQASCSSNSLGTVYRQLQQQQQQQQQQQRQKLKMMARLGAPAD